MNLKQFRYVLTLANEGTFSKAAEKLNISQPSLSQYIKNIEKEIGTVLFERTGSNVRLTDAGRVYIEAGRKIIDIEHQMSVKLEDISENKCGTIIIGLSAHRSTALMPKIIKEFKNLYPGYCVILDEMARAQLLDAAEHGEFDLCITTLPINEKIFDSKIVMLEENVIAVPNGDIAERFDRISKEVSDKMFPAIFAEELDGLDFAMLNDEHPMQKELMSIVETYDININKTVECTSLEALVSMVSANMGLAFVPQCLASNNKEIKYFSIREETKRREIVLISRKNQYFSDPIRDLKEIIENVGYKVKSIERLLCGCKEIREADIKALIESGIDTAEAIIEKTEGWNVL